MGIFGGGGRLLAARSEAGPETWKSGWLRRFLLVAGRLLAAGCQEEKRTWDLVVMLVVEQTACHQEGWSTRYLHFCKGLIIFLFLEIFTTHPTIHCLL